MKKIIIILIVTLITFVGGNIDTNNDKLNQNEYVKKDVEIEDTLPENVIITPEENETIFEEEKQKSVENNATKEEQISAESSTITSTQKEEIVEQPIKQKVQKLEKQEKVSQPKEEPKVVETKPEPVKEIEPVTPKCSGNKHGVDVGNSNKWFNTEQEAINYYDELIKKWGEKWESFEIDSETYDKNCPCGYELWTCPFCEKWTINFYYR